MSDLVLYSREGNVGVITINNPPVNALSPGVPRGILDGLEQFGSAEEIQAIVIIGGGRTFIAGADIKEFGKVTSGQKKRGPGLHSVIAGLEGSAKPTIAAIHGTAFGGGLETSMGCHYRIALTSAQVGQPEVKLGIIPGAQGTQRLPRLAGVEKALEMCALGDPIAAAEAKELGIVDHLIDGAGYDDLLAGAIAFAAEVGRKGDRLPKVSERGEKLGTPEENAPLFAAARAMVAKKRRGYFAPLKNIEAVEASTTLPFDEGIKREAELFQECLYSTQSKALIHAFFGERAVRKIPDVPRDTATKAIESAAVIGAGTMGGGITMSYANAGIPVIIKETSQEALDRGMNTIRKNYERSVKRGRFTREFVDERLALITPQTSYDGFESADIIVEAVFEDMPLKKVIFGEIDKIAKADAVLASNTSTLSIDEIASATTRPEQVIGHHFFSPANVMRLLEIVRGEKTSKEIVATSMALARRLKKVGVLVGNCHGFVGNRMFGPYRREAQFLAEEGATVSEIDRVIYEFGAAMGPLAVGDLAGLDVGWRVRKGNPGLFPEGTRRPLAEDKLVEAGRHGQKTGAGWYKYGDNRSRNDDPEVETLLRKLAAEAGIEQREIDDDEIRDRIIYSLVNEGARILEEGFALRSVDIDIIYLNGYGFPPFRGGPMFYADSVGLDKVLARIEEFQGVHGHWWTPAPLLKELVAAGKTFSEWDKEKTQAAAESA